MMRLSCQNNILQNLNERDKLNAETLRNPRCDPHFGPKKGPATPDIQSYYYFFGEKLYIHLLPRTNIETPSSDAKKALSVAKPSPDLCKIYSEVMTSS